MSGNFGIRGRAEEHRDRCERGADHVAKTTGPKTVNYPPPEGKKPDATFVQKTSKETAHLYR